MAYESSDHLNLDLHFYNSDKDHKFVLETNKKKKKENDKSDSMI